MAWKDSFLTWNHFLTWVLFWKSCFEVPWSLPRAWHWLLQNESVHFSFQLRSAQWGAATPYWTESALPKKKKEQSFLPTDSCSAAVLMWTKVRLERSFISQKKKLYLLRQRQGIFRKLNFITWLPVKKMSNIWTEMSLLELVPLARVVFMREMS